MEEQKKKITDVFSSGTTDEEKKNRFQAGSIVAMGSFLAGGIFQVLWMTVTPRLLGDVGMGLFGPLMFAFYMAATVIALGIPQTVTTFVSQHYEHEFDEALKIMTDGTRLLLQVTLWPTVIIGGGALLFAAMGKISWFTAVLIAVFMVSVLQAAIFWSLNGIMNGFQRLDLVSIGNIVFPIGIFATSVALMLLAHKVAGTSERWDVVGAVAGLGLGMGLAAITAIFVLKKTGLVPVRRLFAFRSAHGLYGKILKFGGLTAVSFLCMTLVQNMTAFTVRLVGMQGMYFGPTPEKCEAAIGHLSTALIFGMATMLITGVAIAVIPAISEAENRGRHDMMEYYYTTALQQSFLILGMFVLIFSVLVGPIIQIMNGPKFPAGVMQPLGVQAVIGGAGAALLFVIVNIFTGLKKPQMPSLVLPFVLIAMIGSIAALSRIFHDINYPLYGFIIPVWTGNIILLIMARRQFGLIFPFWTVFEPLIAGVPPALVALYLMPAPTPLPERMWVVGVDLLVLAVPYFTVLWLFERKRKKNAPAPEGV